ncbi:putative poly [ADP-ribose] polymerase 3 [Acorus calamus]|uniref:Poly [ADP-ribose] polymerase n=1 Tax=Acorus calamus TaxID=4465 RepID=A0AAV9E9E7_ACOCL|nr:putative poly [ADP-ribose] polymerase 3 [Acorus calamus]
MSEIFIVTSTSQDTMFYGPLEKCPICDGQIDCNGSVYQCNGCYSEWTTCKYSTRDPKRREDPLKLPDELKNNSMVSDQYWRKQIEKHGGKVSNGVTGSYCIMQLIVVPDNRLHLYYKKARMGDDTRAEERVEEKASTDGAVEEFARLFEDLTGNEFEPWEREKKFQKKPHKFFPIDMDDGIDVRHGGLRLRQLGIAALHCKLDPSVANFMKILCSQEIYRYAMMEMGVDSPDLPTGMLSNFHLKRCEEFLQQFADDILSSPVSDEKAKIKWLDFSNKWFTLLPSTRPFTIADFQELADHAASVLETVRDITVASHLIGDMTSSTLEDPLFDRYKNLRCSITPVEQQSEDYKMILDYLNKTYEPIKLGDLSYRVSVQNVFAVESGASPSCAEMKKLPNKYLLWCGTRSSNLLRHLHKGFQPAICSIPVAGYMFGRGIVCSDAAAEAARYGFTAVDNAPEDTKKLESKKAGVKGLGRKKTDESEHFVWKNDVKVPCGRIVASEHKESPLEYNEYTVYDPGQVSMRFLVGVKFEEQDVFIDTAD